MELETILNNEQKIIDARFHVVTGGAYPFKPEGDTVQIMTVHMHENSAELSYSVNHEFVECDYLSFDDIQEIVEN